MEKGIYFIFYDKYALKMPSIFRKLLDKLGVLQQMEGLSRHRSNSGSSENLLKSKLENEYDIHRLFEENVSTKTLFMSLKGVYRCQCKHDQNESIN